MDLVTGAFGSLLPMLLDLIKDEYKLQTGVKSSIDNLYKELEGMQAALRQIAKAEPEEDEGLNLWADAVRDLSYDAEDIIDSYLVRTEGSDTNLKGRFEGLLPRASALFSRGKGNHKIAGAINGIMGMVHDVAARRDRYNVQVKVVSNPNAAGNVDPRVWALHQDEKELVGIKDSRVEVIRKLREGTSNQAKERLKVVSIVGIGGLGKTTLAKVVYDRVSKKYDCRAFISVSRNPDLKKVFMDIVFEIDKPRHKILSGLTLTSNQLSEEVCRLLAKTRYFIVIDDIWDEESWKLIKHALVDNKLGSRVITTSRNHKVGKEAGDLYELRSLSPSHSEDLFNRRIFGGKDKIPSGVPQLDQGLLTKCGGVPLAITTMASLLKGKSRDDWPEVYEKIGFGQVAGENRDVENTRKILKFSYYNLPNHLRACLLHLHIFPEDYLIRTETLIWKWAAERLITEEPGKGLYEVGEEYLKELINRNVVMPVEDDKRYGILIGCRIHDLVLDIICSLSTRANFVTVLDGSTQNSPAATATAIRARRLAIQKRAAEQGDPLSLSRPERLRSFNTTNCHFSQELLLSRFKLLRVISIEECTLFEDKSSHMNHICQLLLLNYLGLYKTHIEKLPEDIGNLLCLQTLDLRGTTVKKLPETLARLRKLKCLRADEGTTVPDWIGDLTSLEELRLDEVGDSMNFVNDLGKLSELRELEIWVEKLDENKNKALVQSLRNLEKIQVLRLMGGLSSGDEADWGCYEPPKKLRELHIHSAFSRLPEWINLSSLRFLSYLHMNVQAMDEQDLANLGRLPELVSLTLVMPSDFFPTITCAGLFPKLRSLDTTTTFIFLKRAMQSMESLHFIVDVRALKDANINFDDVSVASALGNLPSLQKVQVEIRSKGARLIPVAAAKAALTSALENHESRPKFDIKDIHN